MKSIAKLTSQNVIVMRIPGVDSHWHTLSPIIMGIENTWSLYAQRTGAAVTFLQIDCDDIEHYLSILAKATLFVFPWRGLKFLAKLRGQFSLGIPSIIYLHGEGTTGFSQSIRELPFLDQGDLFITSCLSEKGALLLCYPFAQVEICPYPLAHTKSEHSQLFQGANKQKVRLLYLGRISAQKNLHVLLVAVRHLVDQFPDLNVRLDVYGRPDTYGSPNMRIKYTDYYGFLMNLTRVLSLEKIVHWHGYLAHSIGKDLLQSAPHIFVSASLHSDESFGMAAFDSLTRGNLCVLSAWGGHLDLGKHFSNLVNLVQVNKTPIGPNLSPIDLATSLAKVVHQQNQPPSGTSYIPDPYRIENICSQLERISFQATHLRKAITPSSWLLSLHSQVVSLNKEGESIEIQSFKNYSDKLVQPLFRSYGMRSKLPFEQSAFSMLKKIWVVPWVKVNKESEWIEVEDPHRGASRIRFSPTRKTCFNNIDLSWADIQYVGGKSIKLASEPLIWLLRRGYAYLQLQERQ